MVEFVIPENKVSYSDQRHGADLCSHDACCRFSKAPGIFPQFSRWKAIYFMQ